MSGSSRLVRSAVEIKIEILELEKTQVMPRCFARMEKALSETEVNHGVPCDATEKRSKRVLSQFPNSLKVREDDVWIASFPKCGTTWTQVSSKDN